MRKIELIDWKLLVDNLPNKSFRDTNFYISHKLYESEDGNYGFLFYNIIEYAMSWYAGAFAVLTNKQNPIYLFNSENFFFRESFKSDFYFGVKSEIIQLVRHLENQDKISEHTFCLLDIKRKKFSIISFECSDYYCLIETEKNIFTITLDKLDNFKRFEEREKKEIKKYTGIEIDCENLLWNDNSQLADYNNIYWNNLEKCRIV